MSRKKKFVIATIVFIIVLWLLSLCAGSKAGEPEYGVSFSPYQAKSLNLDWKKVYVAMLDELKVKRVRVSAYWDRVEPGQEIFDFADLDFQVKEAEKRGTKLILALGRRLPRWPECHDPTWLYDLKPQTLRENALFVYIEAVVSRYQNSPAVEMWQVENEPFLSSFGQCPKPDSKLLDREIALIRRLDPGGKVLITDSGELSLWLKSGKRGDVFGTTLYRYVFSDILNSYWINYNPYWLYRVKGGLLRLLNGGKELVIIELQGEPWAPAGIVKTSIEEQFRTMSIQKFEKMATLAKAVGFKQQYWWGVEWWYWMKENDHPEFWNEAKKLFK